MNIYIYIYTHIIFDDPIFDVGKTWENSKRLNKNMHNNTKQIKGCVSHRNYLIWVNYNLVGGEKKQKKHVPNRQPVMILKPDMKHFKTITPSNRSSMVTQNETHIDWSCHHPIPSMSDYVPGLPGIPVYLIAIPCHEKGIG